MAASSGMVHTPISSPHNYSWDKNKTEIEPMIRDINPSNTVVRSDVSIGAESASCLIIRLTKMLHYF